MLHSDRDAVVDQLRAQLEIDGKVIELMEDRLCLLQQMPPIFRKPDAIGLALEELHTQLVFELTVCRLSAGCARLRRIAALEMFSSCATQIKYFSDRTSINQFPRGHIIWVYYHTILVLSTIAATPVSFLEEFQ